MAKTDILRVENVSVSFEAVKALTDVSLKVEEGEIIALIGANGAGKTTLLETVVGLNRADSGAIYFMGKDITHMSTDKIVASGLSFVPERRGILSLMAVLENLQLGSYHVKSDVNKHIERAFNRFPILDGRKRQMAGTLSGGEQRILSIARGAVSSPKLIMLDEPSLGLAPITISNLFKLLAEVNNKEGCTILISEQNARKALQYSHRGYVFASGRIVLEGTSKELSGNPLVRKTYLGG